MPRTWWQSSIRTIHTCRDLTQKGDRRATTADAEQAPRAPPQPVTRLTPNSIKEAPVHRSSQHVPTAPPTIHQRKPSPVHTLRKHLPPWPPLLPLLPTV